MEQRNEDTTLFRICHLTLHLREYAVLSSGINHVIKHLPFLFLYLYPSSFQIDSTFASSNISPYPKCAATFLKSLLPSQSTTNLPTPICPILNHNLPAKLNPVLQPKPLHIRKPMNPKLQIAAIVSMTSSTLLVDYALSCTSYGEIYPKSFALYYT